MDKVDGCRRKEQICQNEKERKCKSKVRKGYYDLEHNYPPVDTEDLEFPFVPDPDYDVDSMEDINKPKFDENGLILPRRTVLPHPDPRRDLHRELMFNCKTGKSLFSEKSELSRALERHRVNQTRKLVEEEKISSRSEIEKALQERARRLEELERSNTATCETTSVCNPEFLRVHAKMKNRIQASN